MAPSVSTIYIYSCNGTDESACTSLEEKRKTEAEVYWDLGTVVVYTVFLFAIYFLVWMVKFVLKLWVVRKAFKIVSVKGKKLLIKLAPVLENKNVKDVEENQENEDKDKVDIIRDTSTN